MHGRPRKTEPMALEAQQWDRFDDFDADLNQREWLAEQFESLTTELIEVRPSEWAEDKRYLPPQVSSMPGFYRWEVTPYLREIADCLDPQSPVRQITLMKGVQIGATVGILENAIGYYIEHVKTAPMMLITADAELAKLRLEAYIIPMLQASGLMSLIRSVDETNRRKTGKTNQKLEWIGGGFLLPFGAQNANKLRMTSIQIMLRDEIDGWPDTVGKDGDPLKLSQDRTAAYEGSRKIVDVSTPLVKGMSKIERQFLLGDQRRYFVCCIHCGHPQTLRWRRTNEETGEVTGITWKTEDGRLDPESVRYLCEACTGAHTNDDKTKLLAPEHGAEWRATATPMHPHHRSYHVNALYSPVGMQSWASCVQTWLEAWDEENNRAKDLGLLQVFYNNVLGETFELRGEKVRFSAVSAHRRNQYRFGEIPNLWLSEVAESPVQILTCGVDVGKENLAVAVFGWTRARRAVLIDYWRFEGNTEQLDSPATWGKLRELVENREYIADDGKRYRIELTLIDSGYRTDQVYRFCAEYDAGVYPIKGRDTPLKNAAIKEFSEFNTPMGTIGYSLTVDMYKERWSAALRRSWNGQDLQPRGHFNAPQDITDGQLKELTVETKRERLEPRTGRRIGFEWYRPSGSKNELWDLLIYNNAALDLVAWNVCRGQLDMDFVSWKDFFALIEDQALYYVS